MPLTYAALGDSYAAGVGGGARRSECWRTAGGYPVLVAQALGQDLAYQACLGATLADVERDQLGVLGPDTTHVSLTVGGNDVGFVPVLVECAKPSWMVDSDDVIDAAFAVLTGELPGRLSRVLARVRELAPSAELVVTAYPVLFNGEDCNALTFFSPHEMTRLERGVGDLADVIGRVAGAGGAAFVDPRAAFTDHAVCDGEEWLSGVSWPLEESYHPNTEGHAAYARLVLEAFGAPADGARAPGEVVVREGPHRRGRAPTFSLPDLLSRQSLDGALRHGLDPERVAGLARRAAHPAIGPEAAAASAELHELDRLVRERLAR